jgi:hypothetical protein
VDTTDTDPRARIAARLESSTDPELVAVATRWHEISGEWATELFSDAVIRELDFHEHHAGYRDPYDLFALAKQRAAPLDQETGNRLLDYAMAVTGVYELVAFGILHALVPIPDPWPDA